MKFHDFKYERPDMLQLKETYEALLESFNKAQTYQEQANAMDEINKLRLDFDTMNTLASVRHSINTKDEFYDNENAFFDENSPQFSALNNAFYQSLVSARFRNELEEKKGALLFKIADVNLKTFKPEIIEDLQKENALSTEYQKLLASAEIEFDGNTYNLSQMSPFTQHKERDVRRRASNALFGFFEQNQDTLDRIYDDLVNIRVQIADKLGYESFTELGYDRMGRLDYDASDVAKYRQQVYEYIVPVAKKLVEKQSKRIGIKDMRHYDLSLKFLTGNPTPKGGVVELVEEAATMYKEMSPETDEFFTLMREKELMDLDSKKGKAGGGYCTSIANYQVPFIFANFNGTAHDVDVLTHEAGHAFQAYSSRHHAVPEYLWATYEASEIHSMSMEFFAWPWVNRFFKEDTDKYKYNHLASALTFIPYGVAVDEFQHEVYANPSLTPQERRGLWRKMEKKYLPYKVYEDSNTFLENGGFWFVQGHIFQAPFYYIDYTLAQVCAFQYWVRANQNQKDAWESYLTLCQAGGTRSFVGLLELAGLDNPFEQGSLAKIIPHLEAYLDRVDDTKL